MSALFSPECSTPGSPLLESPDNVRARNYILKSKSVEWRCSFYPANQLDLFRQLIFEENLGLINQLSWPEKLSGLSRNGPHG